MKHVNIFTAFLRDTVNIDQKRLDQLDEHVEAIFAALEDDDQLGELVLDKIPQGSWPHRMIIKPLKDHEFDADFLLVLDESPEWSEHPSEYINAVYAALRRHSTYKDKSPSRKCRCVRIVYANDCHVDIVPHLRLAGGRKVIVNRDKDDWEDTNPEGFTAWINARDDITGGNLRKVIRLLKYLRDDKGTFLGVRSVILTTLVGERVDDAKLITEPSYYQDVPTTLLHIAQDLDVWLQARPSRPSVADPSCPGTTFDHRWTDTTYTNFRERWNVYAAAIQAAYDEPDAARSLELWQEIFGEDFRKPPSVATKAAGLAGIATPPARRPGRAG
jgi:hypothetical protein